MQVLGSDVVLVCVASWKSLYVLFSCLSKRNRCQWQYCRDFIAIVAMSLSDALAEVHLKLSYRCQTTEHLLVELLVMGSFLTVSDGNSVGRKCYGNNFLTLCSLGVSVCFGACRMLKKVNRGVLPNPCCKYLFVHINTVTILHML